MGDIELQSAIDFANGEDEEGRAGSEALENGMQEVLTAQDASSIAEKTAEQIRDEIQQQTEAVREQGRAVVDRLGQLTGIESLADAVETAQRTGTVADPRAKKVLDKVIEISNEGVRKVQDNPSLLKKFREWLREHEGNILVVFLLAGGVFTGFEEFLQHVIDKRLENCYKYNLNPDGVYTLTTVPNCNDPGLCNCAHISECGQPSCSENFYYAWNNYDMNVIIGSIPNIAAQTWNNPDFMKEANLTLQILIFIGVVAFIVFSGVLTYRLFLRESNKNLRVN